MRERNIVYGVELKGLTVFSEIGFASGKMRVLGGRLLEITCRAIIGANQKTGIFSSAESPGRWSEKCD
jgi:hypothetical protein